MALNTPTQIVVMAKAPAPGRVKTRLIGASPPALTPEQAAQVHLAMARCVGERLAGHVAGRHVLAIAGADESGGLEAAREALGFDGGWRAIDQGGGALGERLERVWRRLGGGAAAFFGVDSPDVPAAALSEIGRALRQRDVALGPVDDGGYWTLAARRLEPALLRGIDWGSDRVYHQTLAAARGAGLSVLALPAWHDVDHAADLARLRQRLGKRTPADAALRRLAGRLDQIAQNPDPPR